MLITNYNTVTINDTLIHFKLTVEQEMKAMDRTIDAMSSATMAEDWGWDFNSQLKWERILIFLEEVGIK